MCRAKCLHLIASQRIASHRVASLLMWSPYTGANGRIPTCRGRAEVRDWTTPLRLLTHHRRLLCAECRPDGRRWRAYELSRCDLRPVLRVRVARRPREGCRVVDGRGLSSHSPLFPPQAAFLLASPNAVSPTLISQSSENLTWILQLFLCLP